jgi:hypothetical protein
MYARVPVSTRQQRITVQSRARKINAVTQASRESIGRWWTRARYRSPEIWLLRFSDHAVQDPIVPPLLDSQAKASMKGPEIARLSEHSIHGNDSGRTKITFVDVGMKFAHSNPKAKLHKRT